jgi:hypothetical protein
MKVGVIVARAGDQPSSALASVVRDSTILGAQRNRARANQFPVGEASCVSVWRVEFGSWSLGQDDG